MSRWEEGKAKTRPDGNDPKVLGSSRHSFLSSCLLPALDFDTTHPSFLFFSFLLLLSSTSFLSFSLSSSSFPFSSRRVVLLSLFFFPPLSLPLSLPKRFVTFFFPGPKATATELRRSTNGGEPNLGQDQFKITPRRRRPYVSAKPFFSRFFPYPS